MAGLCQLSRSLSLKIEVRAPVVAKHAMGWPKTLAAREASHCGKEESTQVCTALLPPTAAVPQNRFFLLLFLWYPPIFGCGTQREPFVVGNTLDTKILHDPK